jgi:hypothetical protein
MTLHLSQIFFTDERTFISSISLFDYSSAPRIDRRHLHSDAISRDHPEEAQPRGRCHVGDDPVAGIELDLVERVGHRLYHSSDDKTRH